MASTILNESGFRPDVIERQLAHCERNDVRGAYDRTEYLAERMRMMQQYADMLDAMAAGAKAVITRPAARKPTAFQAFIGSGDSADGLSARRRQHNASTEGLAYLSRTAA